MKKYLTYITLGIVGVMTAMALLGLFGIPVFAGVGLKVLFSLITLTIVGVLLLNTIDLIEKKNIIAFVSAALIALSAVLFLGVIWGKVTITATFAKFTVCLSMLSTLFNIIVANVLKLGKKYLIVQVIEYALLSYIVISLNYGIFSGNFEFIGSILFWAAVIISFGMGIALSVLSKKVVSDTLMAKVVKEGYVQIKKEEYDALLAENAELKQRLADIEGK